jgi:hypothetical protein
MKFKSSLVFIIAFVFAFVLQFGSQQTFAKESNSDDYLVAYNQGVKEGIIEPNKVSYDEWVKENDEQFKPNYLDGIKEGVIDPNLDYKNWLKENNYGQLPKSDSLIAQGSNFQALAKSGYDMKAGDVFITNSTSSSGILGHAAIAASEAHILDVPGTKYRPKDDNNRMSTLKAWTNQYGDKWIAVYRMKDHPNLSYDAGHYAYTHFYSTNADINNKNVHLTYGINDHLYEKSPTYCSKLVYQAFYFGTGSYNVVGVQHGFLSPYSIPATFNLNYALYKINEY